MSKMHKLTLGTGELLSIIEHTTTLKRLRAGGTKVSMSPQAVEDLDLLQVMAQQAIRNLLEEEEKEDSPE